MKLSYFVKLRPHKMQEPSKNKMPPRRGGTKKIGEYFVSLESEVYLSRNR